LKALRRCITFLLLTLVLFPVFAQNSPVPQLPKGAASTFFSTNSALSWPSNAVFKDFVWDREVQGLKRQPKGGRTFGKHTCPGGTEIKYVGAVASCSVEASLPAASLSPAQRNPESTAALLNDGPAEFLHASGTTFYCLKGSTIESGRCDNTALLIPVTASSAKLVKATQLKKAAKAKDEGGAKVARGQLFDKITGDEVQPTLTCPSTAPVLCNGGCYPAGTVPCADACYAPGTWCYNGHPCPAGQVFDGRECKVFCQYGVDPKAPSQCLLCPPPYKYCEVGGNKSCIAATDSCGVPKGLTCGGKSCGDSKYTCCTTPTGVEFCPDANNSCDSVCPDNSPKCGGSMGNCCSSGQYCYQGDGVTACVNKCPNGGQRCGGPEGTCCTSEQACVGGWGQDGKVCVAKDRLCGDTVCPLGQTCLEGKCYLCTSPGVLCSASNPNDPKRDPNTACCYGATPVCNNGACQMCQMDEVQCPLYNGDGRKLATQTCCPKRKGCGENHTGCGYYETCGDHACPMNQKCCTQKNASTGTISNTCIDEREQCRPEPLRCGSSWYYPDAQKCCAGYLVVSLSESCPSSFQRKR
jgi:hypothetical protein